MALPAQVADVVRLSRRVTELEMVVVETKLQLQTLPGSTEENAMLRSKVTKIRTVTKR